MPLCQLPIKREAAEYSGHKALFLRLLKTQCSFGWVSRLPIGEGKVAKSRSEEAEIEQELKFLPWNHFANSVNRGLYDIDAPIV